jgi:lysozyme
VKTSLQGRSLIIRGEGFRGDAYLCSAGVPTIGFGSIRYQDRDKVCLGDTISRDDAEHLLTHYIATQIDPMVPRLIPRPLTQPQWDAFASFLYNFGFEKTRGYTLTQSHCRRAGRQHLGSPEGVGSQGNPLVASLPYGWG